MSSAVMEHAPRNLDTYHVVLRCALERAGAPVSAYVVAIVWRWQAYAKVKKYNKLWVAMSDADFRSHGFMYSERSLGDAIRRLEELGLAATTRGRHPATRVPNARYIRLSNQFYKELEEIARTFSAGSNQHRARVQSSDSRIFHKQLDSYESYKGKKTRGQIASKVPFPEERVKLSSDLRELHKAFEKGCKANGSVAPLLDTKKKVQYANMFLKACKAHGLPLSASCEAAEQFARKYSRCAFAERMGRAESGVSMRPDYFVLGLGAHVAIEHLKPKSTFEDAGFTSDV